MTVVIVARPGKPIHSSKLLLEVAIQLHEYLTTKGATAIPHYQCRQIAKAELETIIEAGTYATMPEELGISSCIVARGEETFDSEAGAALLREWGVPDYYVARCFALLGYIEGDYPYGKPRKAGRYKIVEE